jgi:hypothetical protein
MNKFAHLNAGEVSVEGSLAIWRVFVPGDKINYAHATRFKYVSRRPTLSDGLVFPRPIRGPLSA